MYALCVRSRKGPLIAALSKSALDVPIRAYSVENVPVLGSITMLLALNLSWLPVVKLVDMLAVSFVKFASSLKVLVPITSTDAYSVARAYPSYVNVPSGKDDTGVLAEKKPTCHK